jgi:hypothetical protein
MDKRNKKPAKIINQLCQKCANKCKQENLCGAKLVYCPFFVEKNKKDKKNEV